MHHIIQASKKECVVKNYFIVLSQNMAVLKKCLVETVLLSTKYTCLKLIDKKINNFPAK